MKHLTPKQAQVIIDYIDGCNEMAIEFGHKPTATEKICIRIQSDAEREDWGDEDYYLTFCVIFDNFEDDAHYVGFRTSDNKLDLIEASVSIRHATLGEPIYYQQLKNIANA